MARRKNKKKNKKCQSNQLDVISLITETVDIAEEFNKYKSENNNNSPVVVMNPVRSLDHRVISKYEKIIIELGGTVIFFKESPLVEYNSTNKLNYYASTRRGYKHFVKSRNIQEKVNQYEKIISYEQRNLSGLENDMTLSEFANHVNAFAVLVKGDQMMPLTDNVRYWKITGSQKNGFATEYKIEATREQLELSPEKMLLFQAICCKVPRLYRSTCLVNYIKSLKNVLSFENMKQISDDTNTSFGDLTLLIKYFKVPLSYSLFQRDEEVLGNSHQMSFNILKGFPIPLIADQIDKETFNYEDILLPIVRKQAGILLKNRNCNNNINKRTSQIFTFCEHKTRTLQLRSVTPIYPKNIKVPPLNKLFLRKEYPELDPIRWKLAGWCISNRLKVKQLISQEFIIPYLSVWYLVENKVIAKFEGDSIFLAIKSSQSKMGERYQNWNNYYVSGRAVQISLLYVNLCNEIKKLFCSIGLNDVENVSPLRGVVFLNIYQEMKEKSYKRRSDFCKMFNFNPTCFDFNIATNRKNGKNFKHSKPFILKCLKLHYEEAVPLPNDFILAKKPGKYARKLNHNERTERKFKIKSLPWTQRYASEYKAHDPLCQEMW